MVLGIYGGGGLGREILVLAQQINENTNRWEQFIFIDDAGKISELKGKKVMTFEEARAAFGPEVLEVAIAVGEPNVRGILREKVQEAGYSLATLVHPSVSISDGTVLGQGTTICCNNFVSCDITIGENVLVQPGASIGHDSVIGSDSVISTYVVIAGSCSIGRETYIGLHVPVREGIRIGDQSIVGMGSVVVRDIPDNVIAMGNPARAMKENTNHRVFQSK